MANFRKGQSVRIKCDVQKGAFPTELLVTFETAHGPVSGFVLRENVESLVGDEGYIRAVIQDVAPDTISVMVQGSFFTTTGLAALKRDWADSHVQLAHA